MSICTVSNLPDDRENVVVSVLVCLEILCCWHHKQPLTQDCIFLLMYGQKYLTFINFIVGIGPGCKVLQKILPCSGLGMYGLGVDIDRLHQIDDPCIS